MLGLWTYIDKSSSVGLVTLYVLRTSKPMKLVFSKGKVGGAGLPGPAQKFKFQKQRGQKMKLSSSKEDSTPDNTRLVVPYNYQVNYGARYIRLLSPSNQGRKGN